MAANLHLAASVYNIRLLEYPPSMIAAWEALGTGAALTPGALVDGALAVPTARGLGVGLNEAVARANPYRAPRRLAGVRVGTLGPVGDARRGLPDRFTGDR